MFKVVVSFLFLLRLFFVVWGLPEAPALTDCVTLDRVVYKNCPRRVVECNASRTETWREVGCGGRATRRNRRLTSVYFLESAVIGGFQAVRTFGKGLRSPSRRRAFANTIH